MTAEHLPPSVDAILSDPALMAQVSRRHGMGDPEGELNGNLQHLLSPLVGMLALDVRDASEPTKRDVHMLERLSLACALLRREQVRNEIGDTVPDWPAALTGIATVPYGSWLCATATFSDRPSVRGFGATARQAEVEAWRAYEARGDVNTEQTS